MSLTAYWLVSRTRLACQVVIVTSASPSGSKTTTTCGLPSISYYLVVLAVVGVLLLPDAKSIKIGGLEFERLVTQVEQQTNEIKALQQTITTTVNVSTQTLLEELRATFRDQKKTIDDFLRPELAKNPGAAERLRIIDDVAQRIDRVQLPELLKVTSIAEALMSEARGKGVAAQESLLRDATAGETPEAVADAPDRDEILRDILPADGA